MDSTAQKLRIIVGKPLVPVFCFFAGVTYDSLTLTRIDRLLDNALLLTYLTVLGGLIVLTGRMTVFPETTVWPFYLQPVARRIHNPRATLPLAIQFLLGSLFSAYAIFYSQSASRTSTVVFFLVLIGLLVGNEFLRHRLGNLSLLVALYAVVTCSFLTFFLPVVTGVMNTAVFLAGALLTILVVLLLTRAINRRSVSHEAALPMTLFHMPNLRMAMPGIGIVMFLVTFYFLNWIPPVPLSLKFSGTYHAVAKEEEVFRLSFERGAWYDFWKRSDDRFRGDGPAYCFTAVFAPVDLNATIYHRWQHRPDGAKHQAYSTTDRIGLSLSGGREGGYRLYSVKQRVLPGDWRVDVETENGRLLGRVTFHVEPEELLPRPLKTIAY